MTDLEPAVASATATSSESPLVTLPRLLWSTRECAAACGVSAKLWAKMHKNAQVPMPVMLGSLPRWSVRDVRTWISAGCPCREKFLAYQSLLLRVRARKDGD